MTIRIRCFAEMLIMILAVAAPASAQIDAHGYLSDCDQKKALPDYSNDLKSTPRSSLATYCIAELLLQKRNYQASVNAYRDSLAGDGTPVWTKVWSHIQIGNVFDVTRQRERAVREYQLAIQTGDNTDGAINQARELLKHPFEWPAISERVPGTVCQWRTTVEQRMLGVWSPILPPQGGTTGRS